MEGPGHTPVLLSECIEGLNVRPDGVYVDGTVGGGGHAAGICGKLETGRLVAIDKDGYALETASGRLKAFGEKVTFVRGDFKDIDNILAGLGIGSVDGILLDLGVSSFQTDDAERGFSYMRDGPLDMRMDRRQKITAADVVNGYGERELARILFRYGGERFARSVAGNIVRERAKAPIETTGRLAGIVEKSVPDGAKRGNPCKRTFQAIRIEVNGELDGLDNAMRTCAGLLNPGGRMCVITFHSEEDRAVTATLRTMASGEERTLRFVTKKAVLPSETETNDNPRSRSARLRIVEKI